jgi:hypothetical protein
MLLAVLATIAIVGNCEVAPEREALSQSTQEKLDVLDRQLWGTDDLSDLVQVSESPQSEGSNSRASVLRRIEENALQQAGFARQPSDSVDDDEGQRRPPHSAGASLVEKVDPPAAPTDLEEVSTTDMEMELEAQRKELRQMKMRAQKADLQAKHEKAVRQVLEEGVGARMREQQHFYSYMSRWWRLHRHWMKRHNVRLYRKLKEHRALSLATLWKPFLLKWHYVQPRLLQGFRYNWQDDGSYMPKRYLMKSTRKSGDAVVAARIRSVNNLCFPGLLAPKRRHKLCRFKKKVSVRAVQFLLEHERFQLPSLTVLRAYTTFVPDSSPGLGETRQWTKARPPLSFVSVQGLHWQLLEARSLFQPLS